MYSFIFDGKQWETTWSIQTGLLKINPNREYYICNDCGHDFSKSNPNGYIRILRVGRNTQEDKSSNHHLCVPCAKKNGAL